MKRLALLSALLVLAFSSGISNAQNNPVILQVAVSGFAEDNLQLAIDAYQELHPNIQVQAVNYDGFGIPANPANDAETYQEDLLTYFQSADILLVDDNLNSEATRTGYVLDLTPLAQSDPNYDESQYHQTMIDAFKWDFGQWALALSSSFVTLNYSPEAFDAAGLAYPDANWTLDDLIFAAQSLVQFNADGSVAVPGLIVQGGTSLDALLSSAFGQSFADETGFQSVPDYSDPALANLLEQWVAFEAEGITTLPADFDNDDVPLRISNPQQGGGGGRFGNNNDSDTATALLPGGTANMNVIGYAVSAGTSYPMEAYNFALFLTQNANAIAVSGGTVPALINAPEAEQGFGPGGGQNVNAAFEPLVDSAVANGMTQADLLFASGLGDALDLMASDALTASDALETIEAEQLARLTLADEKTATAIIVNPPEIEQTLLAGEVALEFAILGAGGRGGGGVTGTWESLADEFVAQDAQVARINIEQLPPRQDSIPETIQCYYSASNILADADLSTLLSLDPLLQSDPDYNPADFVNGVLEQSQVNGMTYAIPISLTPLVMRIDANDFNQAGVPIPEGTWTVSEFEDALRQLSTVADSDVAALSVTGSTALINLIATYGGQPFDFSGDVISLNFTDPATVNAIQQVLDLAQDGLISYSDGGNGGNASPIIEQSLAGGGGGFGPGGNNANNERITLTFPTGSQGNALVFDTGMMMISADSENPDACYRFMSYVASNADVFNTMPVTYSLINSSRLLNTQGQETVNFYNAIANQLANPDTLALPGNINQLGFGATQWLTGVFDSYLAGEVLDLEAELALAQQRSTDYLSCVENIEFDFTPGNGGQIQTELQACVASAEA